MLAMPGEKTVLVEAAVRPPIGFSGAERQSPGTMLGLPSGAVVCFYTDGLVERRDSDIDNGLERLRQVITSDHPEAVCVRVMAALVGTQRAQDDIALLVARREPTQITG